MKTSFNIMSKNKKLGFLHIGKNIKLSKNAKFYNADKISIGDNSRIDDFCVLSGKISIGKNVHIAAGTYLYGGDKGIIIDDYASISSRCAVYAITDDYSGKYLTNPTNDYSKRNVISKKVRIGKHVVIGTGSTILPGVNLDEGCAVGAMSLVKKSLKPWKIYYGIPCTLYKSRDKIK